METRNFFIKNSVIRNIVDGKDNAILREKGREYPSSHIIQIEKVDFDKKFRSLDQVEYRGVYSTLEEIIYLYNDGTCFIKDSGNTFSKVVKEEDGFTVYTRILGRRDVDGTPLDNSLCRSNVFKGVNNVDSKYLVEFTEHYKYIADGTKLLHYIAGEHDFEVFTLYNKDDISKNLDYSCKLDATCNREFSSSKYSIESIGYENAEEIMEILNKSKAKVIKK